MNILSHFAVEDMAENEKLTQMTRYELLEETKKTRELCRVLDTIIENSTDGLYIIDDGLNTLKLNKAYEKLSGLKREDIMGMDVRELEDKHISKSFAFVVLETKKSLTIEQYFHKTDVKAHVSYKPIFDENGEIAMIMGNIRDLTNIKKLKSQLFDSKDLLMKYESEIEALRTQYLNGEEIIAEDKKMKDVLALAERVAKTDATVLISGATGTGKEELAKFIFKNSSRNKNNFIKVNCGAIAESLVESELFGYEKGSFTGASSKGKAGLFGVADKGTIFLDEVGELSLDVQVKLLRVIQEREIMRVGSVKPIKIDIRIIAATNRDLKERVKKGKFREDLLYRLNVVNIDIPDLKNRKDDIVPMAEFFLKRYNERYGFKKTISSSARESLANHEWKGNIRELRNVIEQAVIMGESEEINDIDLSISKVAGKNIINVDEDIELSEILERMEYEYIDKSYKKYKSVRLAATKLGMNYTTYMRKKKMYEEKYSLKG
jgi:PAS domain S-box-containing protein